MWNSHLGSDQIHYSQATLCFCCKNLLKVECFCSAKFLYAAGVYYFKYANPDWRWIYSNPFGPNSTLCALCVVWTLTPGPVATVCKTGLSHLPGCYRLLNLEPGLNCITWTNFVSASFGEGKRIGGWKVRHKNMFRKIPGSICYKMLTLLVSLA